MKSVATSVSTPIKASKFFIPLLLAFFFIFPFVSASSGISSDPIYLNIFLVIAGIALFLLLVGLGANIPFFTIVGFFIIFVLGFVIQAGNLYIPTGDSVESYSYVNGSVSSIETVKDYSAWDSGNYHIIGWFLMIVGLLASVFSVFAVWGGGY